MRGDILKLKIGTTEKQSFVMVLSDNEDNNYLILFDNLTNGIVGDSTKGMSEDLEPSSLREFSEFIILNNL
jgi:hypothetical protein